MKSSQQIAKEIDLKRFLSIVEDLPKIEKRTAYNFDLPLTSFGFVMLPKKNTLIFKFKTDYESTK